MTNILITGASGNVGWKIIKVFSKTPHHFNIVAGVRKTEADNQKFADYNCAVVKFDFTDRATYKTALQNCGILFLMRPPQISEVKKYFKPLIITAKQSGVKHIVFLSVQGVEKSKIIPHHKIENLIIDSKISYTFLRPAYFMQNFTTTLRNDLVNKKLIFLPAGNAKFTLVDVGDIGSVTAVILLNTAKHTNKAYELTSTEKLTFKQMAFKSTAGLGTKINYISPGLLNFYFAKRKEAISNMLILVMMMLHYLPRFKKEPAVTDSIMLITGKQPITFLQFINDNKTLLTG